MTACALIIRGRGRDDSSWITRSNAVKCTQTNNKKKNAHTLTHTERPEICEFHSTESLTGLSNQSLSLFLHSLNKREKHKWSSLSFPVSKFSHTVLTIAPFVFANTNEKKKLQKQVQLYNVKL